MAGTTTNSNAPEHVDNRGSKVPFADRIDDRVAQRTDKEDRRRGKYYLGLNFSASHELATYAHYPTGKKGKYKCGDDNADVDGCLPFIYSS